MPICEKHSIGFISKCPTCEFERTNVCENEKCGKPDPQWQKYDEAKGRVLSFCSVECATEEQKG